MGRETGQTSRKTRGPSLKKQAFLRLFLITFAAVLIFYALGLSINAIGAENVRRDMQTALETHARYAADQLDQDLERLKFFLLEMASDRQILRFAFSHSLLTDWERQSYIKTISEQEYQIKRSSELVESVRIMLPRIGRTILTEQSQYAEMDPEAWDQLFASAVRGRVTLMEWKDSVWMLLPRFDGAEPLLMIAFSISPSRLSARLKQLGNEEDSDVVLLRTDGTVLASAGQGEAIPAEQEREKEHRLTASAPLSSADYEIREYTRINEAMEPFAHHRLYVWILTVLTLGLLGTYLLYYRRFIMRPLNDLLDSMRQVERDGRYRIMAGKSDYEDLYAQFNHMLDHIETLSGQVYEQQYRAQQAELKQLQMQIDPHFLYNSLYLIYRIAQADGNRSIAHLSQNLSSYYRYITKMPEQEVHLKDEINHVLNYLEIQRVRFEPRIRIEVEELPEEIAMERIPSLIIQPIVENAFQHGVNGLDSGGLITLRYEVFPDSFRVAVSDNSGKMDEEQVARLWRRLNETESGNPSALQNLYRRLQLYEGQDQVLELRSVNRGLTAILSFRRKGGRTGEDPAGGGR